MRCNHIINSLLVKLEPDLVDHLSDIDLFPIILLLKWIRCFFAREASIPSVFCLWDYLFSHPSNRFLNIDYLCLAIIINRKDHFFDCTHMGEGLQVLQELPSLEDPKSFVRVAKKIQLKIEKGVDIPITFESKKIDTTKVKKYLRALKRY